MKYIFISLCPKHNLPSTLEIRFFCRQGRSVLHTPPIRPARGERVDDKRARGVCFCALLGYLSDNRLDMME